MDPALPTEEAKCRTALSSSVYPLRLEADIEPQLNRWLWLVKWFLLIPHFICLLFLWITLILAAIAAFFVLLFTGRYPVGVP